MGIDPGSQATGYAFLNLVRSQINTLEYGVIKNKPQESLHQKISHIYQKIHQLIGIYHPQSIAIEKVFYHKYPQSTIILSHIRGAIIATINSQIELFEYEAKLVKKSIGGTGALSKRQVSVLMQEHLQLKDLPKSSDSSDALAIAYCHIIYQNLT